MAERERCLGGRFVVQGRIGVGGGAVVVRARDRQLGRDVAVKLLRSRDEDLQRRFVQESEVLASMDHPSIVRVLAHDRDEDDLYTVLELIEGPDLHDHLLRTGPVPWRQVVEIGVQIASALDAVHRKGLVHRDVKPANIMRADVGGPLHVKLIDFGVARITENYRLPTGSPSRRPTDFGKALGTPGYLPLEAGLVPADARFDVYSLGATLYELLTGVLPELPLRPLHEVHPGCEAPEDLGLVLAAALALEPEDRTQSAAELGRALAAVRTAHPERDTPPRRVDGRYELIGLAGTGAKGDAYLATHRGTGHDVILKFLRSTVPEDALRFAREAKLLHTFHHPALPRFYDFAMAAQPPYIAMAHAPGEPAARLCSPPRLKPAEVAAVGIKLAEVLAVLHARGVLHRDINASNVMIDATGAVTLIDFGSAEIGDKFYDVPAGSRRYLTPPEARVVIPDGGIGQLAWAAPEARAGLGWSDRSDVYSLAHLLFRLMTGKVPTRGADPPTSPRTYASACPEELAEAIAAALRVDPGERPSAAQFAEALRDALAEEAAGAADAPETTSRPAARVAPRARQEATAPVQERAREEATVPVQERAREEATVPVQERAREEAPAPVQEHARGPRRARSVFVVGLALVIGGIVGWGVRQASLEPGVAPVTTVGDVPAAATSQPAPQQPAQAPASSSSPKLPSLRDALDAAAAELHRCAAVAGEPLVVEFTTTADGDRFHKVTSSSAVEAVERCVRVATGKLRFAPQGPEDFTQEYIP